MPVETRPVLAGICADQRLLGTTYWYNWMLLQSRPTWLPDIVPFLKSLEMLLEPETLHCLDLAKDRYRRELSLKSIDSRA